MFYKIVLITLFVITLLTSCNRENSQDNQLRAPKDLHVASNDSNYLIIHPLDTRELQSLLNNHRGKILVVNVWATWCLPCKEEFSDLIRLADFYRNTDVSLIGLSVDYPDETESRIKPFLIEQSVNFSNYVQNFRKQDDLINLLNRNWRGAVPATFIYDKAGKQQAFLLGKHSFAEFKEKIELLRQDG